VKARSACWVIVWVPLACLQAQEAEADAAEASRIWEQMIDAKGGRTQLYQIKTMVQQTHQWLQFGNPKFKDGDNHIVRVFAFPDHEWDWSIAPLFGGVVRTADLVQGAGYIGYPNNDIRKNSHLMREKELLRDAQLVYFNETSWLKPNPVRVLLKKNILKDVEAIEANVNGERVDFWIDRENHLPVKIITYYQSQFHSGLEPGFTYGLSDYQRMMVFRFPTRFQGSFSRVLEAATVLRRS
jgi:hypothetical protein